MESKLVILTTRFGTNFSGGSLATCEIFSRMENEYKEVIVIGTNLGDHSFKSLKFLKYRNWFHAIKLIRRLNKPGVLFYGDFFNSFLFLLSKVPFYFTYHDNWPELKNSSIINKIKGIFYWSLYKEIFRSAKTIIVVSEFRKKTVTRFTNNVTLIRNGVNRKELKPRSKKPSNMLMVGNIDERKYKHAINLFKELSYKEIQFEIDIYGHINQKRIAKKLSSFPFINLIDFTKDIPYNGYSCLIHTSQMENLSIAWCDAITNDTPIITFEVGGASEIINESNGVLIEPYNVGLMAQTIEKVQKNGGIPGKHLKLDASFSWEIASQQYMKLFNHVH